MIMLCRFFFRPPLSLLSPSLKHIVFTIYCFSPGRLLLHNNASSIRSCPYVLRESDPDTPSYWLNWILDPEV